MTNPQAPQIRLPQQLLALALSALVTTALFGGVLGLAEADHPAQAIAEMLVAPQA